MNKNKKIAMAVVSTVMAGTFAVSLAGCTPPSVTSNPRPTALEDTRFNATGSALKTIEVGGQKLSVLASDETKLAYSTGTTVNVNIIDAGNADRAIGYDVGQIAGAWDGLDGYTYYAGDLKPAWWQFGQTLGIDFQNKAKSGRSGSEISDALKGQELQDYTMISASISQITGNVTELLDLSPYLQYMPNYNKFLTDHEIVKWSLTMDKNGGMYYIPYFDGNDDIEKYTLTQKQWTRKLLDEELPATDVSISFKAQADAKEVTGTAASATPFMGTTGSWSVATTATENVKVNYDAALADAKDTTKPLYTAIYAAAGNKAYTGDSGNIVDLMNFAINETQGEVKGSALLNILRAYIDVAYQTEAGAKYYATRSDVFNSAKAAWDADLMVALFRCVVTNFNSFTGMSEAKPEEVFALAGREAKAQRENDLISLAGELYGVRGLESRLEYTYIGADGTLKDARLSEDSYNAAARLSELAKEGLLFNRFGGDTIEKYWQKDKVVSFMLHDYLQTQTTDGFFVTGYEYNGEKLEKAGVPADYDVAPIVTAVSYWDTDENGTRDTRMRFTESWRSVKNGGVGVPKSAVANKPEVLSALLTFVDYLYSNDGQIVGSYGPMSTKGNTEDADGFWYGTPATAAGLGVSGDVTDMAAMKTAGVVDTVDGSQYFVTPAYESKCFIYNNTLYNGMPYKTRQIPIMTDNNMNFYLGFAVNGNKMNTSNTVGITKAYARNYTNYARGIIGAALPIGNKDQGFEYQCTAQCGLDGAAIVNEAIYTTKIVKHVVQDIDGENWWYTIAPSTLPVSSTEATTISGQSSIDGASKSVGLFNPTSQKGYSNVFVDLAFLGFDTTIKIGTEGKTTGSNWAMKANATELLAAITTEYSSNGLTLRNTYYGNAWNLLKTLYYTAA